MCYNIFIKYFCKTFIIKIMIKKIIFILLATVGLQFSANAQASADQRTLTTKIADLLAQLPAKDAKQLNQNMFEIAELGEDGYLTLIKSLNPGGKGNNALIEYAIGGYSAYVMQSGKGNTKDRSTVRAYCKALSSIQDKQNKQFIISQLELIGKDDAVACLQAYLTDAQLADAAARALVKINSAASKSALLTALPKAKGAAQLAIVESLGMSRTKEAALALNNLANSTDPKLAKVTLFALANIADASSETVMTAGC